MISVQLRVAKDCRILLAFTIPDMNFGPEEREMRAEKSLLRELFGKTIGSYYRAVLSGPEMIVGLKAVA